MPPALINIVEPTLMTEAGHCFSFVTALAKAAAKEQSFRLWVNRQADVDFSGTGVEVRRHFSRRLRRVQSYLLYRRLLRSPGKLFIATAGRGDLIMLDWAATGEIPPGKAYLYVHWFNTSDSKLAALGKIATAQPHLVILGPTPSVITPFLEAGFRHAQVVPYPISVSEQTHVPEPGGFRHLLYAGAARHDKGFSHVVDLVAYLQSSKLDIPITMQISAEHFGKYDAVTRADIQRLEDIAYPHLKLLPETLDSAAYANQFKGAVCVQLYDRHDFADRISGVTLDAFTAGCPIVTTAGTWMARIAQRFGAGTEVHELSLPDVLSAIQVIIADYPGFQARAGLAGKVLCEENNAANLYRVLIERAVNEVCGL